MKINRFLATTITNTLLLLLGGVSLYLIEGARTKVQQIESEFEVAIYLQDTISQGVQKSLLENLEAHQEVISVRYISPEQAFEEFSQELDMDFSTLFESSPLPASFRVGLEAKANVNDFETSIASWAGVAQVNYPHKLREEVRAGVKQLSYYVLGFGVVLAFVLLIVYHNNVRMDVAASSDRIARAIHSRMPRGMIRRPFLRRAYVQGVVAGVVAVGILVVTVEVVTLPIDKLEVSPGKLGMIVSVMVLSGMVLSVGFTLRAVSRVMKKCRRG